MVCCGGKVYQISHALAIKQPRSVQARPLSRGGKDKLQKKRKLAYIDPFTVNAPWPQRSIWTSASSQGLPVMPSRKQSESDKKKAEGRTQRHALLFIWGIIGALGLVLILYGQLQRRLAGCARKDRHVGGHISHRRRWYHLLGGY